MEGTLFAYDHKKRLVAFESSTGGKSLKKAVVFIGGLTNGLLAVPYLPPLNDALRSSGVATLVQPLLTSSYKGFGVSSLDRDAAEIRMLLSFLMSDRGFDEFVLIGHSTGCQDIVTFFRNYAETPEAAAVRAAVLQGPVSDREGMRWKSPENPDCVPDCALEEAAEMLKDEKTARLPMKTWQYYGNVPISAERFWSLCGNKLTKDDMFSSDITDAEFEKLFQSMALEKSLKKVLVAFSENDEFVPVYVDKKLLASRITAAIKKAELIMVPDCHSVSTPDGIKMLVDEIVKIVKELWG